MSSSMSFELETVWESTETNLSPYIHSDTETDGDCFAWPDPEFRDPES